jgi:hypothetical protein
MGFEETVRGCGLDSSGWGQGQIADCCEKVVQLQVPYNAGNFLTLWGTIGLSRQILFFKVCYWMISTLLSNLVLLLDFNYTFA